MKSAAETGAAFLVAVFTVLLSLVVLLAVLSQATVALLRGAFRLGAAAVAAVAALEKGRVGLAPVLSFGVPLRAQHEHGGMPMRPMASAPLGLPHSRLGSGTTWLPDSTPMRAMHTMWGDWMAMLHGVAFLQYDDQRTKRGD